ncbi:hypothetical protein LY76DRAFT_527505, partial [Colletotrichum caudatum]
IAMLYRSAKEGNINQINQLLYANTLPDTKDSSGQTLLWISVWHGQNKVVCLLVLQPEVDINTLLASRRSPLF